MIRIKICGVTREGDAAHAAAAGADLVGLNLWPGSRRFVELGHARRLAAAAREARPGVAIVGVFVDAAPGELDRAAADLALDFIQLHGDEPPAEVARHGERAFKALGLGTAADLARLARFPGRLVLVDTPTVDRGGSGVAGDWSLARRAVVEARDRDVEVFLAGGLTPANVAVAIASVGPAAVDVASGVERAPGVKDPELVTAFVTAARAAVPPIGGDP